MNRIILFPLLIVFILLAHIGNGQKVGLVLSGGGSKGVVHIGVLKALEEYNIPVHCIAGTSMGAVVGGLYASGYSPEEIEAIMTSEEFDAWANGDLNEQYHYYFKEEKTNPAWGSIKFDYNATNNKLNTKLPTNIIDPYEMDFAFMELFANASAVADYNFDSLYIPFRCVASDIENSKAVILANGQLGLAVRASMTFPFYFMPIEIDGKLLFDGGMYNNFPSDVAIEAFNPDVVIGSKAVGNYDSPEQDNLISQIQNMIVSKTQYEVGLENGVLIEHKLGRVNVVDFGRTQELIDSGYAKTVRMIKEIQGIIKDRISTEDREIERTSFNIRKPTYLIDSIHVKGLNNAQTKYVQKVFKQKDKKVIKMELLKKEYFELIADDKISKIFPQLIYNKSTGLYDLLLNIKTIEKYVVSFGGNISSSTANEAFVSFQFRHLGRQAYTTSVNAYFGRFYNSFEGKSRVDFGTAFPFLAEIGFTYNRKDYFKNSTYFFEDVTPTYLKQNENFIWANVGVPVGNTGKLVMGAEMARMKNNYYQNNMFNRLDTSDVTYFDFFSPSIILEQNSLNYKEYANKGASFLLKFQYVDGEERTTPGSTSIDKTEFNSFRNWFQLKLVWDDYFEKIGPVSLGFYSELLISNQPLFHNYISTMLVSPAFEPIPESKVMFLPKYRAHNYAAAGLKIVTQLYNKIDFRVEAYLFQPYREIIQNPDLSVDYGKAFANRSIMGTAVLVWHSPLGPLSVSTNYYDRSNNRFTFFVNFGYIIFNRSAL
ncbi:patatin-like phospholipase family protein [Bacteroidota bacterium]